MKIHEHQAKELLACHGVPVQRGIVAETASAAADAYDRLGVSVAVVKAQIHAGGRGKAGGVVLVRSRAECRATAGRLLGARLITPQTRPEGQLVRKVLVAEGVEIEREFYVGVALDRRLAVPVLMVCAEGGVEIEEVAVQRPEAVLRLPFHPDRGLAGFQARRAAFFLGLPAAVREAGAAALRGLARAYLDCDCTLAEINPLALTRRCALVALDAKMNLDDNALFRHAELAALRDVGEEDPREVEASRFGLNYIALSGSIGCLVNGAGLAMATMDTIQLHGGRPANFLDVGGAADEKAIQEAFRILVGDPAVKAILVNIFGGIMRCDVIARGILAAARGVEVRVPLVVRLEGTNVAEGRRLLEESGLAITPASSLDEAARSVCEAVVAMAQAP